MVFSLPASLLRLFMLLCFRVYTSQEGQQPQLHIYKITMLTDHQIMNVSRRGPTYVDAYNRILQPTYTLVNIVVAQLPSRPILQLSKWSALSSGSVLPLNPFLLHRLESLIEGPNCFIATSHWAVIVHI